MAHLYHESGLHGKTCKNTVKRMVGTAVAGLALSTGIAVPAKAATYITVCSTNTITGTVNLEVSFNNYYYASRINVTNLSAGGTTYGGWVQYNPGVTIAQSQLYNVRPNSGIFYLWVEFCIWRNGGWVHLPAATRALNVAAGGIDYGPGEYRCKI